MLPLTAAVEIIISVFGRSVDSQLYFNGYNNIKVPVEELPPFLDGSPFSETLT